MNCQLQVKNIVLPGNKSIYFVNKQEEEKIKYGIHMIHFNFLPYEEHHSTPRQNKKNIEN